VKYCNKCRQSRPEIDAYCFKCGDYLVGDPKSLRCQACDSEMQRKDAYCTKCGMRKGV